MKRKLLRIAKEYNVQIYDFKYYRADQMAITYDIKVKGFELFHDGYYIGDPSGKYDFVSRFIKFISNN